MPRPKKVDIPNIEIDEPYIYSNKIPTHFVGYDEDRNYQFCDKDWFVVRFSEEQVVRNPIECTYFLKTFIEYIDTGQALNLVEGKKFKTLNIRHNPWIKEDCENMAKNNYRDKYLLK